MRGLLLSRRPIRVDRGHSQQTSARIAQFRQPTPPDRHRPTQVEWELYRLGSTRTATRKRLRDARLRRLSRDSSCTRSNNLQRVGAPVRCASSRAFAARHWQRKPTCQCPGVTAQATRAFIFIAAAMCEHSGNAVAAFLSRGRLATGGTPRLLNREDECSQASRTEKSAELAAFWGVSEM